MHHPLGKLLRDRRKKSGLNQREVARNLGISHVFLGECERGPRLLPEKHWPTLCKRLGNINEEELRYAKLLSRPVALDVCNHPPAVQLFVTTLQLYLDAHRVPDELALQLHAVLSGE